MRRGNVKEKRLRLSNRLCSSGALWSVGLFGLVKRKRGTLISQNQMCVKLRTLPQLFIRYGIELNHIARINIKRIKKRLC